MSSELSANADVTSNVNARSDVGNVSEQMLTGTEYIDRVFSIQKRAVQVEPHIEIHTRLASLKTLYKLMDENSEAICDALNADFGCRSKPESLISDIVGSLSTIRYLIKNLNKLTKPRRRSTSIWYLPASNKVVPLPLGVVGVMSPWNYPVHLMIAPVAAALAAGNRVMAKMSEVTPNTSKLMQQLVAREFDAATFSIVNGEAEVSAHFSSVPFDHLLFTGSTAVGRKIALAAAKNLTPVTLELSGKSPAIVTDFDITEAAKRITWGKVFNSGQTCIAPDYAYVPENKLIEFVRGCRAAYSGFYPSGIQDETYSSVINANHAARIQALIDDAKNNGVEVISLAEPLDNTNKIPYTLVINPTPECKIYAEEVFGPVMSVFTYTNLDDALMTIRGFEDPLAMYVFSKDDAEVRYICKHIRAGGVGVNDTLLHYLQNDLPFGGRGTTGSGQYHGAEGFDTFSHLQPQFKQRSIGTFTGVKLLYPPYGALGEFVGKLIRKLP